MDLILFASGVPSFYAVVCRGIFGFGVVGGLNLVF